jgi:flagellar biosynthesis protein FliR
MTPALADMAFAMIVLLCRIGSCVALLPGFGSTRIPMRIRIMLALAVTLTLAPIVWPSAHDAVSQGSESQRLMLLMGEIVNGTALGLLARVYVLGLQFAATLMTNVVGLAATPGAPIDDVEPSPPLVSLITMAATMVIFAARLEYKMLAALLDSYGVVKIGAPLDPGWYLDQVLRKLDVTWSLGLRLAAPFVVYSVIVNLAIGFANKFTPQISVYFVTTGLVAAGGLILLCFIADDMLGLFLQDFAEFAG